MLKLFKKLFVPAGEKEVTAYDSWTVRWESARFDGGTLAYVKQQVEIFPTQEDAEAFHAALIQSHQLCKSSTNKIRIERNKAKLSTAMSNF
jgi:hypothetical protein